MANAEMTSFVSPGYDYETDVNAIARKRKLAEALQAQSMSPTESAPVPAGGFAVRTSPFQGAAKLAQALASNRQEKKADEQQKALSTKIQADLSNALTRGNKALQGNPAQVIQPDPQENQQAADQGTPVVQPKNIQAVAPYSPEAISNAAQAYMAHPATQPLGMNLAQQNITTQQQLARALAATGVDQTPGGTAVAGAPPAAPPATPPAAGPGGPQPVQVAGPAQPMPQASVAPQPPAQAVQTGQNGVPNLAQQAGQFDKNGVPIDFSRSLQLGDPSLGKYWDYVKQLREPKMSANGQVVQYQRQPDGSWGYAPGAGAVAAAGAFADVGEASKAKFDIVEVPVNGVPTKMTRAEAVKRFGEQASTLPAAPQSSLPSNVPESDRAAYEAVASGKVPAAYGPRPEAATTQPSPKGFGVGKTDAEKAFATAGAESANKYRTAINEKVATGQDLMMRIDESQKLLKQFQAGGGQGVRVQLAQAAQALGAPQSVYDGIARGDLGASQAFQKIVVSQAMESLKQAMASQAGTGAGRITQAEFQIFQKANPNLELDPRALERIYGFIKQTHARDYAEQQGFDKWIKEGKDPVDFQASWAKEIHNRGVKDIVGSGQNTDPLGIRADNR